MNRINIIILLILGTLVLVLGANTFVTANTARASLIISEIMASNSSTITDEAGNYSDWLELTNHGSQPIDISGMYLSDKGDDPLRWQIPTGYTDKTTVPPGKSVVLWADGKPKLGPLHLNFKLDKEGGALILTATDGRTLLDKLAYENQLRDISYGRINSIDKKWLFFPEPTPGNVNNTKGFSNINAARYALLYINNKNLFKILLVLIAAMLVAIAILLANIIKIKKVEEQLTFNESVLRLATGSSPYAVIVLNEPTGNFLYFNRQFCSTWGLEHIKEQNGSITKQLTSDIISHCNAQMAKGSSVFIETVSNHSIIEDEVTLIDGRLLRRFTTPIYDERKNYYGRFYIFEDITEQKRELEEIRHFSFHDKVTKLYNRAYFEEQLKRLDTKRQLPLSIILGDANGLKLVNDTFGHKMGDQLLELFAKILINACRQEDIVARWGGDEFAILLPKTNAQEAEIICQRITAACNKIQDSPIPLSMALGHSTKENSEDDTQNVIKAAEDQMYQCKLSAARTVGSTFLSTLRQKMHDKTFDTDDHIQRLKELTWQVVQSINIPQNELNNLILLADLHDIGNVALDIELFNKPYPLSPVEWQAIQRHPEIGCRIVNILPDISHIAEAILAHHEQWDGKGYPRGLKGEEIPYISRMLAIIHAYDVMTQGRPYQQKMTGAEALAELKKCAGTQFDPGLVNAFLKILN